MKVDFADLVHGKCQAARLRAKVDRHPDKIGGKIRRAQLDKIPCLLVVGQKEAQSETVALRTRQRGDEGQIPCEAFIRQAEERIRTRTLTV